MYQYYAIPPILSLMSEEIKMIPGYTEKLADHMIRSAYLATHFPAGITRPPSILSLEDRKNIRAQNIHIASIDLRLREDVGSLLPTQRQDLKKLLEVNRDLFNEKRPHTRYIEHHINTGNHALISVAPHRLPTGKQDETSNHYKSRGIRRV